MPAGARTPLEPLARLAGDAWLVGGAVRDRLLGRETADYDVAVAGDPRELARALGRSAGGHVFALGEGFGGWRVVARDRSWQVDLLPLAGATITDDLGKRDFTINALAERLGGGELVDPYGGVEDLRASRLRMVSEQSFVEDPLRALRAARLACELEFAIDEPTRAAARRHAAKLADTAAERVFMELKRVLSAPRALDGLALMDELGVTAAVLPELAELHGVEQSGYHHLDVAEHTRAVLAQVLELERDPSVLGAAAGAVSQYLAEPLANELTRAQALRFGALFHDIAKPRTRAVTDEGRVTFIGHDVVGAEMAVTVLGRLRASARLSEHVAALTRHHLRLGFLVHEMPLSRRSIYGYLRACEPVQVDVTVLGVADRLATRGRGSERAIARHMELAQQMLGEALRWLEHPPRPPVRGHELARALGLSAGPELGRVLQELEEAAFAGEVVSREQAIERARELLGR